MLRREAIIDADHGDVARVHEDLVQKVGHFGRAGDPAPAVDVQHDAGDLVGNECAQPKGPRRARDGAVLGAIRRRAAQLVGALARHPLLDGQ